MAELLGAIERGLGSALNIIYELTRSYAVAIIVLTVAVRALLIPLTVKQIRSMTAMQKLAPETKKIQAKFKELQKKAQDRAELQQLRVQMNQEMQGLYRAHGVNPLGGCLPLVAQMPVFIAMFAIMRAVVFVTPETVSPMPTAATFEGQARDVLCRPVEPAAAGTPSPTRIKCEGPGGKDFGTYTIGRLREGPREKPVRGPDGQPRVLGDAGWITSCRPTGDQREPFECSSATGTGHLPKDGKLFADVTRGRAEILGVMHPGCAPNQVSGEKIRFCAPTERHASGGEAVPYYLLVLAIAATSYYQARQMAARATGPQAQQQMMMARIMPVMFGFISLSIPTGANMYFLATNLWTIGQQHILLKRQEAAGLEAPARETKSEREAKAAAAAVAEVTPPPPRAKPHPASKKKRKKKKR